MENQMDEQMEHEKGSQRREGFSPFWVLNRG